MIPKLRFPEFTEAWSEKSIGDVATISRGRFSPRPRNDPRYYGGDTEFIQTSEVVGANPYILNGSKSLNEEGVKVSKVFPSGTIVMTIAANIGYVGFANRPIAFPDSLVGINAFQEILPKYLFYVLCRKQRRLDYIAEEAAQKNITSPTVRKFKIWLTTNQKEQVALMNLFELINSKINLLTKKKEALETYKKGLMQKIFSQELRFKREDGTDYPDWEYVQLGEIGSFSTSSVDKKIVPDEPIVHLINYVDVYHHRDINNDTVSKMMTVSAKPTQLKSSNLKKGDILFTPSSETPDDIGHSVVIEEDILNGVYSYHLMRFRPRIEIDIPYSHYFCNHEDVLKQIIRFATGSTRFTVSVGNFEKVVVPLPSIQEQRKIAAVLKSVESLIEELEKRFNSTLLLKKGLLQQMFV